MASREGALFSSCAYLHWEPAPLVDLLHAGSHDHGVDLVEDLTSVAVGVGDLEPPVRELDALVQALLGSFGALGMAAPGGGGVEGDPGAP